MDNLNWTIDGVGDWVTDETLRAGLSRRKAVRDLGIIRDAEHDFEFTYEDAKDIFLEVFGLDDNYLVGLDIAIERAKEHGRDLRLP